jgi:hypothetical protein
MAFLTRVAVELGKQCRGLFIGQLQVHILQLGALTFPRECRCDAVELGKHRHGRHQTAIQC